MVGEVGEGPRDPRRPWAGTKPALKPLNGISDEQASMFMCRLGGATACYPGQLGCEALDPGCCVEECLSRSVPSVAAVCQRRPLLRLSTRSQARRIREAVRKNKRRSRQDGD